MKQHWKQMQRDLRKKLWALGRELRKNRRRSEKRKLRKEIRSIRKILRNNHNNK